MPGMPVSPPTYRAAVTTCSKIHSQPLYTLPPKRYTRQTSRVGRLRQPYTSQTSQRGTARCDPTGWIQCAGLGIFATWVMESLAYLSLQSNVHYNNTK